jgi:hypothetical protein
MRSLTRLLWLFLRFLRLTTPRGGVAQVVYFRVDGDPTEITILTFNSCPLSEREAPQQDPSSDRENFAH